MSDEFPRSDDLSQGLAPGSARTAGTMFAALYGQLAPHAWRGPEPEHDTYSLFVQRSTAMGWLGDEGGLWGMNDSGASPSTGLSGRDPVAWFQVEANAVPGDKPLPAQPFLRCAEEVTARVGRLNLTAVQVLLPVPGLRRSPRVIRGELMSLRTANWLVEAPPSARTGVEVCLDFSDDRANPAVARGLGDLLDRADQGVFLPSTYEVGSGDPEIPFPFDDSVWNGPSVQRIKIGGEMCEWSGDALGWLAGFVADCVGALGGNSPMVFTATRAVAPADRHVGSVS